MSEIIDFVVGGVHPKQRYLNVLPNKYKPDLVIGSPPCKYYSRLQQLVKYMNRNDPVWLAEFENNLEGAKRHVVFCCHLYDKQRKRGAYFLHEHPWSAGSCDVAAMKKLTAQSDVMTVYADQCQFGLETHIKSVHGERGPAKKPTGFMTNAHCIAESLARVCPGDHKHIPLMGGRADAAAKYPMGLCRAICGGLVKQLKYDKTSLVNTGK